MAGWRKMNHFLFSGNIWGKSFEKLTLFVALPCQPNTLPCPSFPSWGGTSLGLPGRAAIMTKSTTIESDCSFFSGKGSDCRRHVSRSRIQKYKNSFECLLFETTLRDGGFIELKTWRIFFSSKQLCLQLMLKLVCPRLNFPHCWILLLINLLGSTRMPLASIRRVRLSSFSLYSPRSSWKGPVQ